MAALINNTCSKTFTVFILETKFLKKTNSLEVDVNIEFGRVLCQQCLPAGTEKVGWIVKFDT